LVEKQEPFAKGSKESTDLSHTGLDPHKVRELVLLLLYSFDMGNGENDDLLELLKEECKVSRIFVETALERAKKVVQALKAIDEFLEKVSHSYSVERLHSVERNVLRLAIYELLFERELPPKVVLSEAKRLAKKFSSKDAALFVQTLLLALCDLSSIEVEG
jgi:transcription antitermination protein NusB